MFSSTSSLISFFVSIGFITGSNTSFRPINLESNSNISQTIPVYELNLSKVIENSINPFECKDVDYIFQPFSNEPMMVPIDATDRVLMARIQRSESKINSFATAYGVFDDVTGRKAVVSLPFSVALPPQNNETVNYDELYADIGQIPVASPEAFNTPPTTPEQTRKRRKIPDTPAVFVHPVTRRCRAALIAFHRSAPESSSAMTPLQNQFNRVLFHLGFPGFSGKEFQAFEEDFDGQFATLVERCPEDVLVPAMLYALMSDEYLPKFTTLYERQVDYWQANSRRFSSQLLRGIFLLPQTSAAALQYFQTLKNPRFFFNHESEFNFLIGCFYFEDVVQAMAFASGITESLQNSISFWLNTEARTIKFDTSAPDSHFKGFLMLLYSSRVLFDHDLEHLEYIKHFFEVGVEVFSGKPIQMNTFLLTFSQTKMILHLIKQALLIEDRNFIAQVVSLYEIKDKIFRICPIKRQVTPVIKNGEFFVEISDRSGQKIFKFHIL